MLASIFKFDVEKGRIMIGKIPIEEEKIYGLIYSGIKKVILIVITIILMFVLVKIGKHLINNMVKRQKNLKFSIDDKKALTIGITLKSILKYVVYFIGVFTIIKILFGGLGQAGSVLAGVGGAAIGFGAQSLIKDVINGFFILFENQFSVGDFVTIGGKEGLVEAIELRVTRIKGFNGDLHIIPNGTITEVTNHSRDNMRITIEIPIGYNENVDKAIDIISSTCEQYKNENSNIVEGPEVYGMTALNEKGYNIRIVARTKPMSQWEAEVELRKKIKKALDEANVKIPYSKLQIIREE